VVDAATEKILRETCSTLVSIGNLKTNEPEADAGQDRQRRESTKYEEEEKECSSILSAISNEEVSITSEILDQKSFCPRKNSDGEDLNGHICHIDSPETDTYPNSDALHGESLMDDISSMLGEVLYGYDQDSIENTYTDDTTLFTSDGTELKLERRMSMKRDSIEKKRKSSRTKLDDDTQFGFENRAFMSQHVYLDNKLESEPTRYCSLAQFVEGNDIARRSFKRVRSTTKISKTEANVNRQSTLMEESEVTPIGSHSNLNKLEKELSNVSTSTLKALEAEAEEEKKEEAVETPKNPEETETTEKPTTETVNACLCGNIFN
jgi:diacylglycerol kinase (ATP)